MAPITRLECNPDVVDAFVRKYAVDGERVNRRQGSWTVRGGYSRVYEATFKDNDQILHKAVVKEFLGGSNREQWVKRLIKELTVWPSLNHKNINGFFGILANDISGIPAILSPFVEYDALDYGQAHPNTRLNLVLQLGRGLEYLHCLNVIHGDVKTNNFRVSGDGIVKIIDFGLTRPLYSKGFTTIIAYPNCRFTAPEVLDDDNIRPTKASDIYSFSMTMLQMIHGKDIESNDDSGFDRSLPFNDVKGASELEFRYQVVVEGRRPRLVRYRNVSPLQESILRLCWNGDPGQRPSISTVIDNLGCET